MKTNKIVGAALLTAVVAVQFAGVGRIPPRNDTYPRPEVVEATDSSSLLATTRPTRGLPPRNETGPLPIVL
jgi:hypothetical protein